MESYKILEVLTGWYRKSYNIVINFWSRYYEILEKILYDPAASCQSCLQNPKKVRKRFYSIIDKII